MLGNINEIAPLLWALLRNCFLLLWDITYQSTLKCKLFGSNSLYSTSRSNQPCSEDLDFFNEKHFKSWSPLFVLYSHHCILGICFNPISWPLPNNVRLSTSIFIWSDKRIAISKWQSQPGCSKLMMLFVNVSLKYQMLISYTCQYFL